MDQPSRVTNPARGQLNKENKYSPVPIHAREFGLARRVQPNGRSLSWMGLTRERWCYARL